MNNLFGKHTQSARSASPAPAPRPSRGSPQQRPHGARGVQPVLPNAHDRDTRRSSSRTVEMAPTMDLWSRSSAQMATAWRRPARMSVSIWSKTGRALAALSVSS